MAGSLNHITSDDGTFTMDFIENMGDAHEALEDCFEIIRALTGGDREKINEAAKSVRVSTVERDLKEKE